MSATTDVDGTWNITLDTPMGKQRSVLELAAEGGTLTGTGRAMGNSMEIRDGRVDGAEVTFGMRVTRPIPMTLTFRLVISGSTLAGEVVAGPLGTQKVTGRRADLPQEES